MVVLVLAGSSVHAVTIDLAAVSHFGNAADPSNDRHTVATDYRHNQVRDDQPSVDHENLKEDRISPSR